MPSRRCSATGSVVAKAPACASPARLATSRCLPLAPTRCLVRPSWCLLLSIHLWPCSPQPTKPMRSPNTRVLRRPKKTSTGKTPLAKRPACSPVRSPPTPSTASRFLCGSPTTYSWATAPEPSWPCRVATIATSSSPASSVCRFLRFSSRPRLGSPSATSPTHSTHPHGPRHSSATPSTCNRPMPTVLS